MNIAVGFLLAALFSVANKPKCTAQNNGQFWPLEANTNRVIRAIAIRQGKLEICTVNKGDNSFRYFKWQFATINAKRYNGRVKPR